MTVDHNVFAALGTAIVAVIERVMPLPILHAVTSGVAALAAVWVMHLLDRFLERAAVAALAGALALNAATPVIVSHPPWLSDTLVAISVCAVLVVLARRQRAG